MRGSLALVAILATAILLIGAVTAIAAPVSGTAPYHSQETLDRVYATWQYATPSGEQVSTTIHSCARHKTCNLNDGSSTVRDHHLCVYVWCQDPADAAHGYYAELRIPSGNLSLGHTLTGLRLRGSGVGYIEPVGEAQRPADFMVDLRFRGVGPITNTVTLNPWGPDAGGIYWVDELVEYTRTAEVSGKATMDGASIIGGTAFDTFLTHQEVDSEGSLSAP